MLSTGGTGLGRSPISVQRVEDERSFALLAHQWNRLADLTDPRSVFLRHEWFDAAWQWLRDSCSLHVICVSESGNLVAICPLVRRRAVTRGVSHHTIEFMLVPDSEHCDVLGSPAAMPGIVPALVHYLIRESGWDRLRLEKLRPDSNVENFLLADIQGCRPVNQTQEGSTAGIDLTDTWPSYYGRRTRRLKKGNNHIANKISRSGRILERTRVTGADSRQIVDSALEHLTRVSASSWKYSTGNSLDQPGPGAFIKRLTEHAVRNDWLSMWLLRIDDQPVAVEYQLCYRGIVSALRADYDQQWEALSPGTYLNWKVLESLFEDPAVDYYSMGPGQNDYKLRWAEDFTRLRKIDVFAPTIRGRILAGLELWARPVIRALRHCSISVSESIRARQRCDDPGEKKGAD